MTNVYAQRTVQKIYIEFIKARYGFVRLGYIRFAAKLQLVKYFNWRSNHFNPPVIQLNSRPVIFRKCQKHVAGKHTLIITNNTVTALCTRQCFSTIAFAFFFMPMPLRNMILSTIIVIVFSPTLLKMDFQFGTKKTLRY